MTEKYFKDKENNALNFVEEIENCKKFVIEILQEIYQKLRVNKNSDSNSSVRKFIFAAD